MFDKTIIKKQKRKKEGSEIMAGIQIGGIASGFDTTSIVEELMKAEKTKVDNVLSKQKVEEYRQEAYVNINNAFSDFILKMRNTFGVSNHISNSWSVRPSAMNSLSWLNKATSSNSNLLVANATSAATPGTHQVTVKQLADNVKFASSSNVQLDATKPLSEQGIKDLKLTISTKNGDVVIEDTDGTMTLQDLAKQLNNIEGINASYDETINRFFIGTSDTGSENFLQITDENNSGILSALNLDGQLTSGQRYEGKNAIVDYNGATNIEFNSNTFNLQGVEMNLKGVNPNETVTVTIETDADALVERLNTFVDEYNTLMEKIADELSAKTYYDDYPPLTDEQKKEMTEKEIELWEAKTKSGLMRNDSVLKSIQSALRESIFTPVTLSDGSTVSLSDFGIEGKGYFEGGSKGQIKLDTDKLRQSLQTNSGQFMEAFFGSPSDSSLNVLDKNLTSSQISEKRKQSGLFNRVSDILVGGMQQIISKAGTGDHSAKYRNVSSNILTDYVKAGSKSALDYILDDYKKRVTELNNKLSKIENRYWKQFTAMETAINKLNSQSSAFYSYMG